MFDDLARTIGGRASRRGALRAAGLAIGGLFGALKADEGVARRRRPRPCPPCQRRRNGRCRPQPDGALCGECQSCQGGQCLGLALDETPCAGNGRCGSGRCFPPPVCGRPGTFCSLRFNGCCGGCDVDLLTGSGTCARSTTGDPCFDDTDCTSGLTCRVFTCG